MDNQTVYLASNSPRRYDILRQLGYQVRQLNVTIDETAYASEKASDYVQRMAYQKNTKALSQWRQMTPQLPPYPLISADTIVVLDDNILGKPLNAKHAREILHQLSGRNHQVLSAVCVYWHDQRHQIIQTNEVSFATLSNTQIDTYIDTQEPLDKAGAYGIQGLGGTFVSHIKGSFTGIMGLPVYETTQLLAQCGFAPL